MYYHYRRNRKKYRNFGPESGACAFCNPRDKVPKIISESKYAYVIDNRTHYDQWEMSRVLDHLLIVPKRHVLHLSELNAEERADIMDIIADYEGDKHYEVYARSPVSKTRSIAHQHTHLIKTDHKPGRALIFLRRPYVVWRLP